ALRELDEEAMLRHLTRAELEIARHVLDQNAPAQKVLRLVHAQHHVLERLARGRQRQQVVRECSTDRAPGQMLRRERRLLAVDDLSEPPEVSTFERIGRAERQADAVEGQWIVPAD